MQLVHLPNWVLVALGVVLVVLGVADHRFALIAAGVVVLVAGGVRYLGFRR